MTVARRSGVQGAKGQVALGAGGNDTGQIKIPSVRVVTVTEKHTVAHSAHVSLDFAAVTWDQLLSEPLLNDSDKQPTGDPPPGFLLLELHIFQH